MSFEQFRTSLYYGAHAAGRRLRASLGAPGQLGRVAEAEPADLVLLDTTGAHHLGTDHPVPALALHARGADAVMMIVDGRAVHRAR